MKSIWLLSCITVIGQGDDGAKELAPLAGTWRVVSVEEGGEKVPEADVKKSDRWLRITHDKVIAGSGERTQLEGTIVLNATRKPREIDMTDFPVKGKTTHGIYRIDGRKLLLCYDLPDQKRPTEFKTARNSNQRLISLVREDK